MSLASLWVCVHLAVACSTAPLSPCLTACTGLTFDLSSSSVTLLFLRGLHFPCWDLSPKSLVCSGLMTSLLCSFFSLPHTLVDSCSLTALLLFASFIFCLCRAEPRTQLCLTGLGLGTAAGLEPWLWGETRGAAGQLQCWASPAAASGAGISYSTWPVSFWPWTHNLEIMEDVNLYLWCVICVWKFRLF